MKPQTFIEKALSDMSLDHILELAARLHESITYLTEHELALRTSDPEEARKIRYLLASLEETGS